MAGSQNKTKATRKDVGKFIEGVENDTRREDALRLLELMTEISGQEPKMWGPSIIGFGSYHYKYDSGREGDSMRIGFSPRKANQVLYIMPGYQDFSKELDKLGKHRIGKSCLYINKLADVDEKVLVRIMKKGLKIMDKKYPEERGARR